MKHKRNIQTTATNLRPCNSWLEEILTAQAVTIHLHSQGGGILQPRQTPRGHGWDISRKKASTEVLIAYHHLMRTEVQYN